MKETTVYICEKCGAQSRYKTEIEECEREHYEVKAAKAIRWRKSDGPLPVAVVCEFANGNKVEYVFNKILLPEKNEQYID